MALAVASISPLAVGYFTHRAARADHDEDRRYRLEVAAEADRVARTLLASNANIAGLAAEAAVRTERSLGEVHKLVDGNLTQAILSERTAVVQALTAIDEVSTLMAAIGVNVPSETAAVRASLAAQLATLDDTLSERQKMGENS